LLPDATIYVLNGLFGDPSRAVAARLIPFISSREALAEWPDAPFALNIDTGMNRLGMTPSEAFEVTRRPALLASHFACADTPSHPQNREQEAVFAEAAAQFAGVPASLANSAATLTRPEAHYALNRPGIALYGGAALEGRPPLEPAVRVEARVIQVREVKAGAPVGYGAAETVKRDSRLAVVSAGYADGYLRAAGGRDDKPGAKALVGGIEVPLVGRVSMDLITIDVTDAHCQRGDYVELFGPGLPLRDVASAAGTIGYEFLTALSRRAERRYAPL
ncbi:MAG: alanine racemase C-terminal domain-containing protein, partial [Pseudomonadota bacterium]